MYTWLQGGEDAGGEGGLAVVDEGADGGDYLVGGAVGIGYQFVQGYGRFHREDDLHGFDGGAGCPGGVVPAGAAVVTFAAGLGGLFAEVAQKLVDAAAIAAECEAAHGVESAFHVLAALLVDGDGDDDVLCVDPRGCEQEHGVVGAGNVVDDALARELQQGFVGLLFGEVGAFGYEWLGDVFVVGKQAGVAAQEHF